MEDGVTVRDGGGTAVGVTDGRAGSRAVVRVLGGFSATVGDDAVNLGGPRQRAVLARILIAGSEAVTAEQVLHDVWDERSAEATVGAVQAYVSRLRRLLGPAALPRRADGYVLDRDVVRVDADLFVADVDAGRRALARGNDEDAAALLEAALARWTGPCAFGVGAQGQMPFLAPVAARLEEQRVVAAEALADVHARQGRAADDVALLEELAARDPLRESLTVAARPRALRGRTGRPTRWRRSTGAAARSPSSSGVEPDACAAPGARRRAGPGREPAALGGSGAADPAAAPQPARSSAATICSHRVDAPWTTTTRRPRAVALAGLAGHGQDRGWPWSWPTAGAGPGRVAWWIAADDPAGTAAGLADLAAALGHGPPPAGRGQPGGAVGTSWTALPGWLLVCDNADDPEAQLGRCCPPPGTATSSSPRATRPGGGCARPSRSPPLARAEAVGVRRAAAPATARRRGGHARRAARRPPLALGQACAYIEQTGMSRAATTSAVPQPPGRPAAARPSTVAAHRRHHMGARLRPAGDRSPRAAVVLETIAFLSAGRDRGRDIAGPGSSRRRAGAAGGARGAAAAVAGRAQGRHAAGAPAGAGRGAGPAGDRRPPPRGSARATRPASRTGPSTTATSPPTSIAVAAHSEALAPCRTGWWPRWPRSPTGRRSGRSTRPPSSVLRQAAAPAERQQQPDPVRARACWSASSGRCSTPPGGSRGAGAAPAAPSASSTRARTPTRCCSRTPTTGWATCCNCADDADAAIGAHERALATLRAGRADDLRAGGAGRPRATRCGPQPARARPARRCGRAGACWRREGRRDEPGAGRTPPRGSAWSSRTWASWTRRWRTSARPSRSYTRVGRPGPPRHRPGARQARLRVAAAGRGRRGRRGAPARRPAAGARARAGRLARRRWR